ncbi:hypothetical protein OHA37_30030 [Streptomyces sp. NBC_00335]|uniref:hypothetical protein n=1 Tax=unclassified Streptomyces TaxID=2593676 RepID=UPI002259201E|nr:MULTISPECIES: hypothetical protein [unclassified Streptomyces]MCX5408093.1 hypothetical protein [Streptomyces sp. NBC_00086]
MTTRAVHLPQPPRPTQDAAQPSAAGPGAGRKVLAAVAVAATVPYLALKTAWLAGSHLGIPAGSVLLEPRLLLTVANAVTVLMDAAVILLVLVLIRPWGKRVPSWLLVVPSFVATGLLTPIVLGFPGQLLLRGMGLGPDEAAPTAAKPFLDDWVFHVVYTGFIVQAVALAGLFVPYARERWGRRWQGPLGARLPSPTGVVAGAAAALGAVVAAAHFYWALGGTAGQNASQIAQYSSDTAVATAVHGICALTAVAGAVLLARGGTRRAGWPLAVAWTGSAATLCWGMWMLAAFTSGDPGPGERTTTASYVIYGGQMITALLATAVLGRFLAGRREG